MPSTRSAPPGAELTNLLVDLDALGRLLSQELDAATEVGAAQPDHLLDAFLFGAGMTQVVEDLRHRLPGLLASAARSFERFAAPVAARASRATAACAKALTVREDRTLAALQAKLHALVSVLAQAVVETGEPTRSQTSDAGWPQGSDAELDALRRGVEGIRSDVGVLPAMVRTEILRLPDCFRAFDQQPADCQSLAARFAQRWPPPGRPLDVVGVRTSGSYLAPLLAACLQRLGYPQVRWCTLRPGQYWRRAELARLRTAAGSAMALVVDDPPVTGAKVLESLEALAGMGFPHERIVVLLALLGSEDALPERLAHHSVVTLPWDAWACHRQLEEPRLTRTLQTMLTDRPVVLTDTGALATVGAVDELRPAALPSASDLLTRPLARSHLQARYRLGFHDVEGTARQIEVEARGTGLGYLGRHALAVGTRLEGLVPPVLGFEGGLLFSQALPETARLETHACEQPEVPEQLAGHIAERASRLAEPEDTSMRLRGRGPVWEHASYLLRSPLASAGLLLGPAARRLSRRLVHTDHPSIVDGNTGVPHWFVLGTPDGRSLLKTAFDERAFSVWDHACYDAVWDLAIAAADHALRMAREQADPAPFACALRAAYEAKTGTAIASERWVLYQAMHLRLVRQHLERLARQGVGQLQTHAGTPPAHPDIVEAGFDEDVQAWIRACRVCMATLAERYAATLRGAAARSPAVGRSPASDAVLGALRGSPALSARGLLTALFTRSPTQGRSARPGRAS